MRNILLVILFLFIATSASAATYKDAVGRQININGTPARIISLVPSVTEILFAIGAEQQLVAVTDYCTYPDAATRLPSIGSYADPGLENILAHEPDLVIATAAMNSPSLVKQLENLGIPVFVVHPRSVEDTLDTIRMIGRLTGSDVQAQRITTDIDTRIQHVAETIRGHEPHTVLACIILQPLTVAGPDTFVNDIIEIAGGMNMVPEGPARYPTWNFEALLNANPEYILLSPHPGQPDIKSFFSSWPQLRAVRDGQIVEINADWLYRPGPRMILGIETLAKILHPDLDFNESTP